MTGSCESCGCGVQVEHRALPCASVDALKQPKAWRQAPRVLSRVRRSVSDRHSSQLRLKLLNLPTSLVLNSEAIFAIARSAIFCPPGRPFKKTLTVQSVDGSQSRRAEAPRSDGSQDGVLPLVKVVSQDLLEAQVGVNDEGEGECAIEKTRSAMFDAGGGDERDETDRNDSLKYPVIRSVRRGWRRVGRRVVDSSLDVRWNKGLVSSAAHEATGAIDLADTYKLERHPKQLALSSESER